ncbi:MAG TPA: thioesterase domain-containing protein, partial [Ktedonobacteraceae bacterium]
TIDQLAQALASGEEKSPRTPIIAVQAKGSLRPFFYLHGAWDSDAFYCFHLARYLEPDQPFYALAPYNFDGLKSSPSVEEMAAAHIQALRSIQSEGPYLLGGFCNGGLVAYEMARQLQAEGQGVGLLVLIAPAYPPALHLLARGVVSQVGNLFQMNQEKKLGYFLRLRHMYKYARRQRRAENLQGFRVVDPSILTLIPTADALRQDDHGLLDWIIMDYCYEPFPGKITLIWPREEPFPGVWRAKAAREKDIELHTIPGTHISCRTDHVKALAEELNRCLAEGQADALKGCK